VEQPWRESNRGLTQKFMAAPDPLPGNRVGLQ
jgi:hypothetical protein